MLRKISFYSILLILLFISGIRTYAQFPRFKVLAFYSIHVEPDHVDFAWDAIRFFKDLTSGDGFVFDTTSNMADLNDDKLKGYSVVMMINDFPHTQAQREAFQRYMENGGGWFGFHISAYNDKDTKWPWLNEFLGCGIFYRNNWPPLPAKLVVDDGNHPVTRSLPPSFISPVNEWYQRKPGPREKKMEMYLRSNYLTGISMKHLLIFSFLFLLFLSHASIDAEQIITRQNENTDHVTHIREVYKTIDTFNLKIDIFYTAQSFEKL
jgi:hypothetical protein